MAIPEYIKDDDDGDDIRVLLNKVIHYAFTSLYLWQEGHEGNFCIHNNQIWWFDVSSSGGNRNDEPGGTNSENNGSWKTITGSGTGFGINIAGTVDTAANLPDPYTGNINDILITQDDGHGHLWDGAAFVDIGTLQGPAGPQGSQGPVGEQGLPGDDGVVDQATLDAINAALANALIRTNHTGQQPHSTISDAGSLIGKSDDYHTESEYDALSQQDKDDPLFIRMVESPVQSEWYGTQTQYDNLDPSIKNDDSIKKHVEV